MPVKYFKFHQHFTYLVITLMKFFSLPLMINPQKISILRDTVKDLTYYMDVSKEQLQNPLSLYILELFHIYSIVVSKVKSE